MNIATANEGLSVIKEALPGTTYRVVANKCASSSCPTVYAADADAFVVVQGYVVQADQVGVTLPEGETLVRVPLELLSEAVRNLS